MGLDRGGTQLPAGACNQPESRGSVPPLRRLDGDARSADARTRAEAAGSRMRLDFGARSRAHRVLAVESAPLRRRDRVGEQDRKSTRLNSSHLVISYAVFCLKKKNKTI